MKILVASCDKNADLFEAFHICLEKYGPDHPEVIYSCETIPNTYYKSVLRNYSTNLGTRRVKETLQEINDDIIIMMCDDCFIRSKVDQDYINKLSAYIKNNVAFLNFEKSFDKNDTIIDDNVCKRSQTGNYKISVMCGMGDRKKLIDVLNVDLDPWEFEYKQNCKSYDYLINRNKLVIDFGHYKSGDLWGLGRGQGMRELQRFFDKEGIKIDYTRRGFYD